MNATNNEMFIGFRERGRTSDKRVKAVRLTAWLL